VLRSIATLVAHDRCCIDECAGLAASDSADVVERCKASCATSVGIEQGKVPERDQGRDGLPGSLDDDPLPCCGQVDDLAEPAPHIESTDGSHSAIIAL
jgi:hypothetical protein